MFGWFKKKTNDLGDFGKKITNAEEIKKHSEDIMDLAGNYLSPKKILKNAKVETFEDAKRRLKVTEGEINQVYKNYAISFYISLAFAFICFIGFIYYAFFMQQIIASLSTAAILCVCAINAFKFSFRAFQIKHKKLCSVNDWWERSYEWFPKI